MYTESPIQFWDIGRIDAPPETSNDGTLEVNSNKVLLNYRHGYHPVIIWLIIFEKFMGEETDVYASMRLPRITRINAFMNL
jgi:hypothetical protein